MPNQNLPGSILPAPPGLKGFDSNTVMTAETAQLCKSHGYDFCIRYLSRGVGQSSGDLSNAEALTILDAGLALMAVQHVAANYPPGWSPNAALGKTNGDNAAANAQSIGLPAGMNIWVDLEGVDPTATSADIINYCQEWYKAVSAVGYVPGLYVGVPCGLTSSQLYSDLSYQHYWCSLSRSTPDVATRGYQMQQTATETLYGVGKSISIDPDTTQTDNKGGNVLWLQPPNFTPTSVLYNS